MIAPGAEHDGKLFLLKKSLGLMRMEKLSEKNLK